MKILIAHNAYQYRGGEDVVVDAEIAMLRERGHQVSTYRRHNDELRGHPASAVASTIWSRRTAHDVHELCQRIQPDVIHVHNTFPLISPSLYWSAFRKKIPVVQTLHNFRILCPQAMLLRDGRVCEDCVGKIPWRAITRKCYRASAAKSALLSGMLIAHDTLGTYRQKITRYIVLSDFCRQKFIEGGLPAQRLRVKPNFTVTDSAPTGRPRSGGLYIGRLAPEKGIQVLIQALALLPALSLAASSQIRMLAAGSGPLEAEVSAAFGSNYLGYLDRGQVSQRTAQACYVVVPSTCYEAFGMVVVEAFASGTPVIASRHGSLAELVQDGVTGMLVEPGNVSALAAAIFWAETHPLEMARMGRAARAQYERLYTPEQNYRILMDIYQDAIVAAQESHHAAYA